MIYKNIIQFIKLTITCFIGAAICAIIGAMFQSCSRKVIDTEEKKEYKIERDSTYASDRLTDIINETEEWWEAYITKTTYSAPDSTGHQYQVSVETTEARGGKVVHDTITIQQHDTIEVKVKVSGKTKYVYKEKKETVSYYKILIHSILTLTIFFLLFLVWRHRDKMRVFFI